ncbi:MAG: Calx-beta domain-containing protein [Gaiellaceae bacterium]
MDPNVGSSGRRPRRRLIALAAFAALLVVPALSASTLAETPAVPPTCAPAWGIVSSPNPTSGTNRLGAVSALSPTSAWAVGHSVNGTGDELPLVARWNGTSWTGSNPAAAAAGDSRLTGVAPVTATNVFAVGYTVKADSSVVPLVLRWDGTSWSASNPAAGTGNHRLTAVTAVSASDVIAVGYTVEAGAKTPLILRWDGTTWNASQPAAGTGDHELRGVAAISGADVIAVGRTTTGTGDVPLVLRWGGTTWNASNPPAGLGDNVLNAVRAVSGTDVVAVGTASTPATKEPLVLRWNGTVWTSANPSAGLGEHQLLGVAASAANDVWAVGTTGGTATLALHWDGTAWTRATTPNGTGSSALAAASTAGAGHLWAVGSGGSNTLVEHFGPCPELSGRVTSGGAALGGVTVALGGAATGTTTTALDGTYSFSGLTIGADYTVTPSKANNTFSPPSASANDVVYDRTLNFAATPDDPPAATTNPATGVTQTTATLNGTVNPKGKATTYRFEYGTTTAYGSTTSSTSAGSDSLDHPVSAGISSLTAGTTYHFRVVATSAAGTASGLDRTFETADPAVSLSPSSPSVTEGDAGAQNVTFTVSLSAASSQTVTVQYATGGGTAAAGTDYTAKSGTLSFAPGETSKPLAVSVIGDDLDEGDETFGLALSSPTNATIAAGSATVTITDDDTKPTVDTTAATSVTQTGATLNGTVNPHGKATTYRFEYGTSPGSYPNSTTTAAAGSGTAAQPVSATLVNLTAGTTYYFRLVATSAAGTTYGAERSFTTGQPSLSIANASAGETNAPGTMTFTVTLSAASTQPVTVSYATADGTATAPADFGATSGSVTFNAGQISKTISVAIVGDSLDEIDETFTVLLSGATNASIADGQATGTIADEDPTPGLATGNASVTEGNVGATPTAAFTVTLGAPSGRTVTVDWSTADGSAVSPLDYVGTSGSLTFAPGQTTKTVNVTVNGDVLDELDETFTVNLAAPVNATLTDAQGVGTIVDDEAAPTLSVSDVSVNEADAATKKATFTVTLSAASGLTVTVDYATQNVTAVSPADYDTTSGTLTFAPGQTSKAVDVTFRNDALDEPDETFDLKLSNPANATISDSSGTATILDDDATSSVSVNDVSVSEGDSGTTIATFTVTPSAASGRATSVSYATQDASATQPADYASASGTIAFAAGETSKTVAVTVNGDHPDENDETFNLVLSSPSNLTLGKATGVGTIRDDDTRPAATTSAASGEGETGATLNGSVNPNGKATTYRFEYGLSTAYGSQTAVASLPAGTAAQSVSAAISGLTASTLYHYRLTAASPAGSTDGTDGTFTTRDPVLSVSADAATVAEGDSASVNANFTVKLSSASSKSVTVQYAAQGNDATAGEDFAATAGTLTFAAGQTQKTVTVPVLPDTVDEDDETFKLVLSSPASATLGTAQATVTIIDNDPLAKLTVDDVSKLEGTGGTTTFTFNVRLAPTSGRTVTVQYATQDGSAVAGSDYTAKTATLTFAKGETVKQVDVTVTGDSTFEADETFSLALSNVGKAEIQDSIGVATIRNDDTAPYLSIDDKSIIEGNSGTASLVLTVKLCQPGTGQADQPACVAVGSGLPAMAKYASANGSATAPSDYDAVAGTLTIPAGQTSGTIAVPVKGDAIYEPDETFTVTLTEPVNANMARDKGTGTVRNDDQPPVVSINDSNAAEGGAVEFTVTLCAPGTGGKGMPACVPTVSGVDVEVTWAAQSGNQCGASPPAFDTLDFQAVGGLRHIAPGKQTVTLSVPTTPDKLKEPDKKFCAKITLPGGSPAVLGRDFGVGTIVDDDSPPTVSINDVTVTEGDAGQPVASFTVTFSNPSEICAPAPEDFCGASVKWATQAGTAGTPADFSTASGSVHMTPPDPEASFSYQLSYRVDVPVAPDALDEPDEQFAVALSDPKHATLGRVTGTATVVDDDSPPLATTDGAGDLTTSSATLNGRISPSGKATSVWFEYGPTIAYGSSTQPIALGADGAEHAIAAPITGLAFGTTYHFRIVARNATGTTYGADRLAPTALPRTLVTTGGAANPTISELTVGGAIRTWGQATTWWFEYGLTSSYGSSTPVQTIAAGALDAPEQTVSTKIGGLSDNRTYHFRLVATRGDDTVYGADATGETQARQVDRAQPVVRFLRGKGRVQASTVSVGVKCLQAEGLCRGVVALEAPTRSLAAKGAKAGNQTVGKAAFSARLGKTATIKIRLSASAMRVLRRTGVLRVTAVVSARDAVLAAKTSRHALTLRAPRR